MFPLIVEMCLNPISQILVHVIVTIEFLHGSEKFHQVVSVIQGLIQILERMEDVDKVSHDH